MNIEVVVVIIISVMAGHEPTISKKLFTSFDECNRWSYQQQFNPVNIQYDAQEIICVRTYVDIE